MSRQTVTLKAELSRGTFYWVAIVNADSEDEAVVAAEHLFMAEVEKAGEWTFSDYEVASAD